jgi:capsular exopolysaccharide synthesis family protein
VKSRKDAEHLAESPILSVVPKIQFQKPNDVILKVNGQLNGGEILEVFRSLRSLLQAHVRKGKNTFLLTSPTPDEGRSFIAANLARVFADQGSRVLLIDADMRNPGLHEIFQVAREPGMTDVLAGTQTLELALKTFRSYENLYLLTSGKTCRDPVRDAGSDELEGLIREAKKEFDLVILDSAPLLSVSDSRELGRIVDQAVLVVMESKTQRSKLQETRKVIEQAGTPLLGVILNGAVEYTLSAVLRTFRDRFLRRETTLEVPTLRNGFRSVRSIPQKIRKLFG